MRTLFIHIGAPKTGTTAVQSFLKQNRQLLMTDYDLSYPNTLSNTRATAMYVYATQNATERRREKLRIGSMEMFNLEYETQIRALAGSVDTTTAICSNELLFRLNEVAAERLKSTLSSVFTAFQVILYLRRQDLMETAAYLQAYKGAHDQLTAFNKVLKRRRPGFLSVIDVWSRVFGKRNMRTFLYDDVMREEEDVVGHFMRVVGVDDLSGFSETRKTNSSWGLHQAWVAQSLRNDLGSIRVKDLGALVETVEPGPRYPVSRAEAIAFYRSFARENEAIRERYFPGKTSLFEEDFNMYPETFDIEHEKNDFQVSREKIHHRLMRSHRK